MVVQKSGQEAAEFPGDGVAWVTDEDPWGAACAASHGAFPLGMLARWHPNVTAPPAR